MVRLCQTDVVTSISSTCVRAVCMCVGDGPMRVNDCGETARMTYDGRTFRLTACIPCLDNSQS